MSNRKTRLDNVNESLRVASSRIDFFVEDHGSIFLLRPMTDNARSWIDEHLPEDRQTFGPSVVVEHRYIDDIIVGILNAGLAVRRGR